MTEITMYMDPNCSESKEQMDNLAKAGNSIECKDLTFFNWSRKDLLPFVRGRDPLQIMNSEARQIKHGKIDPLLLTFDEALDLMVDSPELIRGPLVRVGNLYIQGKKDRRLNKFLADSTSAETTKGKPTKLRLIHSRLRKNIHKSPPILPYFGCSYA